MKGATVMATTSDAKRIQFNAADKDYSAYYDGEYIGTFSTYHQAEIELDAHALDLLERGLVDTVEGITTMQWQTPRDVVYARPAETVEVLHSPPEPTPDPGQDGPRDPQSPGAPPDKGGDGAVERFGDWTPERLDAYLSLPAASPAAAIEARTSDSPDGLEVPTGGREEAAPMSGYFLTCTICGGPHVPTQCPKVALVKYGMGVWEAYMEDRAAFLKLIQWATAARLALMGEAVAFYLSHRWRHDITAQQVLVGWQIQNAAQA